MSKYDTFWPRFWANFVDGLVFIPLSFADRYFTSPDRGSFTLIAWAMVSYSVYWLYSVFFHARYGQTLGKMALHIMVLDVSEERIPTFRQAFMRDIGYIVLNMSALVYFICLVATDQYVSGAEVLTLPGQILTWAALGWFLLEILSMLTNQKRRAFHDFIAGTVVVRGS